MESNINHQFYDSLLTEVQIVRQHEESLIVVGEAPVEPLGVGTSLTAELRRRFLAKRGVMLRREIAGCYKRILVYPWSCDRGLDQVAANATAEETLAAFEGKAGAIEELRHLAYGRLASEPTRSAPKPKPNFILYARGDTQRRRLLNASAHFAALQAAFGNEYNVVLWEEEVLRRNRSLDEQIDLVRHAARVLTPHGTWPSTMGLLLPRGAVLHELMGACYPYSWLPRHIRYRFGLRHTALRKVPRMHIVPGTAKAVRGCNRTVLPDIKHDVDLRIDPQTLVAAIVGPRCDEAQWPLWQPAERRPWHIRPPAENRFYRACTASRSASKKAAVKCRSVEITGYVARRRRRELC